MPETLRMAVGSYPHTEALQDGRVRLAGLSIEHVVPEPAHRAFRPMANALAYDVAEMAIVTYLLAKDLGRPLVLLPIVLMRQPELPLLVCPVDSDLHTAQDLAGRTVGVRAYTQTTATWVRGILQDTAGLDPDTVRWRTFDPAHLDEFTDPATVTRMPAGTDLLGSLRTGELDAAIVAWDARNAPGLRPVLDAPMAMETQWIARSGVTPVNHLVCVKAELLRDIPSLGNRLVGIFAEAKSAAGSSPDSGQDAGPSGIDEIRPALDTIAEYAHRQGITRRRFTVDELFEHQDDKE
ncbi:MAG: hypothetical protein GEV10_15825 [Streptosporangiales bacterium]|nr:hypothetical protein [Streptosporangiales bacterium]